MCFISKLFKCTDKYHEGKIQEFVFFSLESWVMLLWVLILIVFWKPNKCDMWRNATNIHQSKKDLILRENYQPHCQNQHFAFRVFIALLVLFRLIFSTFFYCNVSRFYSERTDLMSFKPHTPQRNWMEGNGSQRWGKLRTLKKKKDILQFFLFSISATNITRMNCDDLWRCFPSLAWWRRVFAYERWISQSLRSPSTQALYRVTLLEAACRWKMARSSCPLIFVHA